MTRSFLGQEDKGLGDRLADELPRIFNWAVAGWKRLREQGRFTVPASVSSMVEDLNDITSPIGQFVKERCQVHPEGRVSKEELYAEWRRWCESNGIREPKTANLFGRDLMACCPEIRNERPRTPEGRVQCYRGIQLKPLDADLTAYQSETAGIGIEL
jgi:putative DNA primase/helicase